MKPAILAVQLSDQAFWYALGFGQVAVVVLALVILIAPIAIWRNLRMLRIEQEQQTRRIIAALGSLTPSAQSQIRRPGTGEANKS